MQKVLVCGATGFIGRNLVERLAQRADLEVHGTCFTKRPADIAGVRWHEADLRREDHVGRLVPGFDIVIQAAATTSGARDIVERPYIHTTDNAVMNSLLLRAAYDAKVKHFLFFSCSVMYPSNPVPLKEDDWDASRPLEPRYQASGWTKVYIEKMCEFYAGLGVTRHTIIRHSNVYGPHDKFDLERSHVFGATVTKVMTAPGRAITVWGSGEEARDLLYVDDLVDFVECAIEQQTAPYALYNVGCGRAISVDELARSIIAASGRALDIEHDLTKPSIPTSLALDCGKAARELGWQPKTTLKDGIAKTLAWWQANEPTPHAGAAGAKTPSAEEFYRAIYRIRRVEEKIIELYPSDKIKSPVHLSIGQEAVSVGVSSTLAEGDIAFGTYRGHALYLAKGGDMRRMIAELYGKLDGAARGKAGSMHLIDVGAGMMGTSAIVATTIPQAVGYAFALKSRKSRAVVAVFFGDGALDEGVAYESMNFAALRRLPILFVCENNFYAIYSHIRDRMPEPDPCARATVFGIPTERIADGNVRHIFDASAAAVAAIREGGGPRFLECLTYRWRDHVGPEEDRRWKYRPDAELDAWIARDEMARIGKELPAAAKRKIEESVDAEIADAISFAEGSAFPPPAELYADVFRQ
ncbi:MAG TPA: thiamine pyrophosphate-dependent enzyme [Stellaceae bacterium]|nr:thiamine pyrophosphate-dependent enzyme [Stellaceae bacterium]